MGSFVAWLLACPLPKGEQTDGYRLTPFALARFSRDRPRCNDNLDVIKFLCKDLWTILFRKQIDNLKTNHRVCPNSTHTHGERCNNTMDVGTNSNVCHDLGCLRINR